MLTCLHSPGPAPWTTHHPLGPPSYTPPAYPLSFSAPPTPSPINISPNDLLCAQLERSFARNLFHGIVPNTTSSSSRARFHWPFEVTPEQQLLLVIRCMRQAGFDNLGDFGLALLSKDAQFSTNSPVALSLSAFVRCKSQDPRTHPVALVDLLFNHRFAQEYVDRVPIEPAFTLPRHALPPSQRLLPALSSPDPDNTTRNALMNWSLLRVLERVDVEVPRLFEPSLGLVRTPSMPLSWSSILKWDLSEAQEAIAQTAPATFALAATISVNERSRKILETTANPQTPPAPPSTTTARPRASPLSDRGVVAPSDEPSSSAPSSTVNGENGNQSSRSESESESESEVEAGSEPDILASTGVPPSMRRDPWLVSVARSSLLIERGDTHSSPCRVLLSRSWRYSYSVTATLSCSLQSSAYSFSRAMHITTSSLFLAAQASRYHNDQYILALTRCLPTLRASCVRAVKHFSGRLRSSSSYTTT